MKLAEALNDDPEALDMLCSLSPHREVARALGVDEKAVRRWRKANPHLWGQGLARWNEPQQMDHMILSSDREMLHAKLDELLDKANTGQVTNMRLATWDGMIKDNNGDAQVVRQYGVRLETGQIHPSWPVVQPAADLRVIEIEKSIARVMARNGKVAVILPDPQIGYRFYSDSAEYDPFHDEAAMDVATQIVADVMPDKIICLGDYLDLPNFSKYEQEASFARTTQKSLDRGHEWLRVLRTIAPMAQIIVLEGNHDRRLELSVTRNAMEAFGLRRASEVRGWPVLSLPHLLRLDDLGVTYVGGYPAGAYWLNDRLKCIHGSIVRSAGSTAKAVVDAERASVIFGHVHRIETQYKTADVRYGGSVRLAHTPGCLCRIDGAVPSFKGSTDLSGRPVTHYEDWQQGLTIVSYDDGDAPFSLETVFINTLEGHRAVFAGKIYSPRA